MNARHSLLMVVVLSSCGPQRQPQEAPSNSTTPALPVPSARPGVQNEALAEPVRNAGPAPQNQASLPEPKGPIDPKSVEAAGQVVQHYGALLEQNRLADAAKLWGDATTAAEFARKLNHPKAHMEIGDLGETEGAAGSIYTTIPVVFYGDGFRRPADVILRRVNDVPGSTEAQRRWHIERIELKAPA
jgi:hypothetical protein